MATESLSQIMDDVDEVFCYQPDRTYQDRSHEYLERHQVPRGYNDTACQRTVQDLCMRAFAAGRMDGMAGVPGLGKAAADLTVIAGRMLQLANELRGIDDGE